MQLAFFFSARKKSYNKSFIDQACSVKMAGYWPRSFFCVFMDRDFVSVHKHEKRELGQYPAILTSRLVNNPYVFYCFQVDGPITGEAYKRGEGALITGILRYFLN